MMQIHHIGYLVKNIQKAQTQFEMLGYQSVGQVKYDEYRDIDILFMEKDGYTIELVCPKSKESVVSNLIKTYRNAPYHMCYETECFDEEIENLERNGFTRFDEPCPAPALNDRRVCFLLSPRIGMIELLEESR